VQVDGHTITVTELDGRRIARLRVAPSAPPVPPAAAAAPVSAAPVRLESSEKSQLEGG
jgi:hypothetical protein